MIAVLLLMACQGGAPIDEPVAEELPAVTAAIRGPLTGLTVYLSAGHGYASDEHGTGYQRSVAREGIIEDVWTGSFASDELIPRLEDLGAVVLTARERDRDTSGFTAVPSEVTDISHHEWPAPMGTWERDEPVARLLSTGTARWTVASGGAATNHVYVRWLAASDADPRAVYTVLVGPDETAHTVDQRVHGSEWIPLRRVPAGETVEVTLTGSGNGSLSADRVRVGGGTWALYGVRQRAYEEQDLWSLAGKHNLQSQDAPSWVWEPPGSGMAFDATTRARWAAWSHPTGEDAVLLSLHTNAGGGSGTMVFVRNKCLAGPDCTPRAQASTRLGNGVRERILDVMRARRPAWQDYGTIGNDFAEINEFINPGMPAILIEFGFHDHPDDALLLTDDAVRGDLADAVTQGVVAWWRDQPQAMAPLGSQ